MNTRPTPPPVVLLGIPFHDVTFGETIAWAEAHIERGRPGYIATANLDFVMQARRDPELQRILLDADLVVADGAPLVRLSARLGPPLRERVTGSDLTPMLAEMCARRGWPLFALGAAEGVAAAAVEKLRARFPGLPAGGAHAPPYANLLDMDHAGILERIHAEHPALLLVAFGAPKQEKWINLNLPRLRVPLSIGVGGTLDFIAGRQHRAPRWVQRLNLEWLWRMGTDPRRLAGRYLANAVFLADSLRRMLWLRHGPAGPADDAGGPEPDDAAWRAAGARRVVWTALPDAAAARARVDAWAPLLDDASLAVDAAGADWMRSHELGVMVALARRARAAGHRVALARPGPRLRRLLAAHRLDAHLPVPPSLSAALDGFRAWDAARRAGAADRTPDGDLDLRLPVELTAATLPAYRAAVERALATLPPAPGQEWRVDAARLEFLDSAALGFLVALRARAIECGVLFSTRHWRPLPRRVLNVARLEALLAPPAGDAAGGVNPTAAT